MVSVGIDRFRTSWQNIASSLDVDPSAWAELGDELARRHSEHHRRYHTHEHIVAVVDHLEDLNATTPTTLLAAFFHDAIYDPTARDNEERSALLAESALRDLGIAAHLLTDVASIIRATATHRTPQFHVEGCAAFLDADLAIFGASPEAYDSYVRAVRQEYAHIDDATWRTGRRAVLEMFLEHDPLYLTSRGQWLFADAARRNLLRERRSLTD